MISKDDVVHVARLARLKLTVEETERFVAQLQGIVGYVESLQAVDVTGVEPLSHPLHLEQPRRPDVVADDVVGRRALEGSAGYADGLVRVPRVIE